MKDALLSKNGIVKCWWDVRGEEKREDYEALSDIELADLMDDDDIEIIEQKAYPDEEYQEQKAKQLQQMGEQLAQAQQAAQKRGNAKALQAVIAIQAQMDQLAQQPDKMVYDVSCKRTERGRIRIENVPPEEFLISRKAKSIADSQFVGHRVLRSMSELRSQGYKDVEYLTSDDAAAMLNMERVERMAWDDEMSYAFSDQAQNHDESQRLLWVTECYIKIDFDGDGIAELRKVVRAGNQILENEVVDCAPFVSITPVPLPHRFFGLSIADLAEQGQKVNTSILRGVLDNMHLQINGRYFAVEGQVNLDDLLTSRPGGVVRMKQPNMAGRLDQGMGDANLGMGMLEYMKGFQEDATGWTRYNQGSDGDSLNKTATGVNQITNRADMRLDLIARNFASGFRELFRLMLKLCSNFDQRDAIVKLRGTWVSVNPRDWKQGFDCSVNVGLGTGSKDQQVAHLMMMLGQQQFGLQIGTANPRNVYEAQKKLAETVGFKNGDKFFQDPSKAPPMPNPDAQKFGAQAQLEREKMQFQAQSEKEKLALQAQIEMQKAQHQKEVDITRQQAEAEQHAMKVQIESQQKQQEALIKAQQEEQRLAFEKWKAELQTNTQIYLEKMKQQGVNAPPDTQVMDTLAQMGTAIQDLAAHITAPRKIVRGPDGRAMGVEINGMVREIQRGADGRPEAL